MPLDIEASLTKKVGPLPVAAWAVIIGGGLGILYLMSKRRDTEVPIVDVTSPDTSLAAIQRTSPGYIPTPVPIYDTSGPITSGSATSGGPGMPVDYSKRGTIGPGGIVKPTSPIPPIQPPPVVPTVPTAPKPTAPTPVPQPSAAIYPGLPAGYVLNCANSFTGLHGSYATIFAQQKASTGQSDGFVKRNMMAIALQGGTTPWAFTGDFNNPISINNRRIKYGLAPLTQLEIDTALNQLGQWSKEGEAGLLSHAETYFNTWSVPYQCTSGNAVRKTR